MTKRNRLEIIKDILNIIHNNHNSIKPTPLLRKSNLSTKGFSEYLNELIEKEFVKEITIKCGKYITLTDKGLEYIRKYRDIVSFIEEFDL